MQAIARPTQHAGQVTLTISSTHGERSKARRSNLRIAGLLAQLRQNCGAVGSGAAASSARRTNATSSADNSTATTPRTGLSRSQQSQRRQRQIRGELLDLGY
jgi:hypothetical protein